MYLKHIIQISFRQGVGLLLFDYKDYEENILGDDELTMFIWRQDFYAGAT